MATRTRIRAIDRSSSSEIDLVARRMGETLVEVLGEERGSGMYSHEWLLQRVKWHLDPERVVGEVFVSESATGADGGQVSGHAIVRVDADDDGRRMGLFSTLYVAPAFRHSAVAKSLIQRGEAWMVDHGMSRAVTYTDKANTKLHNLFAGVGYRLSAMPNDFVSLSKTLAAPSR